MILHLPNLLLLVLLLSAASSYSDLMTNRLSKPYSFKFNSSAQKFATLIFFSVLELNFVLSRLTFLWTACV